MQFRMNVQVNPGSSHRKAIWRENHLKVNLKSPPEDGAANDELIEYVAHLFDLEDRDVTLARGETSRKKTLRMENLDREQLVRRIDGLSR